MAIKEFTIGPQNYFEEGYFSGDYTQSNVSRAFLECDIDNFKGFRVVTGEYFEDNYIDGTYYHNNTMNFGLVCEAIVVQEVSISLSGYYQDGYFAQGYFTPSSGSSFTLFCRIGIDQFAEAVISSSATMTATVGKIIQNASQLVVTVTQTSTISHIEGADLFAFSEASIAAQVDRIRDNNIAASAVFSVATDFVVSRSADADVDAIFSAIINGLRSRDVNLETQAAFSFSASPSSINSASAAISSASTLVSNAGKRILVQAALTSQFSVSASVFDLTERPRQYTVVGSPAFSDSVKKFGTHSYYSTNTNNYVTIPDTNGWSTATWRTFDTWVYIPTDGSQIGGFNQNLLRQFASNSSNQSLLLVATSSGIKKIYRFQINAASGSSTVALKYEDTTNGIIGFDTWAHIRVLNDGSAYHLWINGSKKLLTSEGTTSYISNLNIAAPLEINKNSLPSNYSHPMYMDELLITSSTITGSGVTSFTPPTAPWLPGETLNQSDVLVLSHFDNVFDDDLLVIKTGAGALVSTATFSASADKTQGAFIATTLPSVFTQSTIPTKTVGTSTAYLYAFFNLSSEIISSQNAVMLSVSTLTATARKTARITKTLANIFVLTAQTNNATGSVIAFLQSQATISCTPFKADKNPAPIPLDNYRLYHFDAGLTPFDGQPLRATYFQERGKFGFDAVLNPTGSETLGYVPGFYPPSGDNWSIEFWHRGRTNNTGFTDWRGIATIFGNRWLEYDGNANRYRIRGLIGTGDPAGFNNGAPGAGYYPRLAYNWTHIAIQRKDGVFTFFVNGVSAGSLSDSITTTSEISFGTNTNGALTWTTITGAFDEMRINTLDTYYTGNFTPAIAAYATEAQDFYTVESAYGLLEPKATVLVTAIKLVVTTAVLSTSFTSSFTARKTARITRTLTAEATVLATAGKRVAGDTALASTSTFVASVTPTRLFDGALSVAATQTALVRRFRDPNATAVTSTAATSAVTGFLKQFNITLSGQGGFAIDAVANLAGVALLESAAELAALPSVTRLVAADLTAEASTNTIAGYLQQGESALTSQAVFEVTSFIKVPVQFAADLAANAAIAVDYTRIRDADSAVTSEIALSATVNANPDAIVPLSVAFTSNTINDRLRDTGQRNLEVIAEQAQSIDIFRGFNSDLALEATTSATITRIKQLASEVNAEFAVSFLGGRLNDIDLVSPSFALVTASVTKSTDTQAALTSEFASSTENIRVRFADTAMTTTAAVTASAVKTVDITKTLAGVATVTAAVRRFRDPNLTALSTQFTQTANGSKDTDVIGQLAVTATVVVEIFVSKAIQAEAALAVSSTISAVNDRRRNTASALVNAVVLTASVKKTAGITKELVVAATLSAQPTKFTGIILTISAQGFVLVVGDVINIDPRLQLVIRPETRYLIINSETRVLTVV
jgi:hypothetical protein